MNAINYKWKNSTREAWHSVKKGVSMRNYKRILAVLCTIALSLGLSVYAVAAESSTLKEAQKEDAIQTLLEGEIGRASCRERV